MLQRTRSTEWRYWLLTDVLLLGTVLGCNWSLAALALVTAVHCLRFLARERSLGAFPMQVRLTYAALLALGAAESLAFIHWIQLAGTTAVVTVGYCPLARLLALMPWNRRAPLDRARLLRILFGPPVQGSILDA